MATIDRDAITGLILAGGRGQRMRGLDKGLQRHRGDTLVSHALRRLQPQVGQVAISANRNLAEYRAFGLPVWTDTIADHPGPLAGWLSAMQQATTPFLVSVPCDAPDFPLDLVEQLADRLADADLAIAATPSRQQPVFCLMRCKLAAELSAYLHGGDRQVMRWVAAQRHVEVLFSDESAFNNLNTLDDLLQD